MKNNIAAGTLVKLFEQSPAIGVIGLMASGIWPVDYALAGIAAGVSGIITLVDYLKTRPKVVFEENKNPVIKVKPDMMLLAFILPVSLLLMQGCLGSHPLLKQDSLKATLDVSQEYITGECKSVAVYPGYELDFSEVGGNESQVQHGFGGIIGGCGKYARISCTVVGDDNVVCKQVEKLVLETVE